MIEIGNYEGGTALWMAHQLDAAQSEARIIGVDVTDRASLAVQHPRIQWVVGDALDPKVLARVEELAEGRRGLVIEDSDHKYHVTKAIMESYARFVALGCYLLVEDTIVDVLGLPPTPGPLKAVREFVESHADTFVVDRSREKYVLTYNPMGYLLRKA